MVEANFAPELVTVPADGRIALPKPYCDKIPWICGDEPLRVWLLLLVPGRFRLLPESEVDKNDKLKEIRARIIDGPVDAEGSPLSFETNDVASLLGRLIPTTLSAPRPARRLTLPKLAALDKKDEQRLVIMFSIGYLELWHLDVYQAAMVSPLDALLS
jgi:hypothetical protein